MNSYGTVPPGGEDEVIQQFEFILFMYVKAREAWHRIEKRYPWIKG